jgi:2-oxoglutarate dehydrogenase E1 component
MFTPKSLLRDSRCVSTIEEFENGSFQETIDDDAVNKADVKTLVFCTVNSITAYRRKRENERKDVAIVRIEQLFL